MAIKKAHISFKQTCNNSKGTTTADKIAVTWSKWEKQRVFLSAVFLLSGFTFSFLLQPYLSSLINVPLSRIIIALCTPRQGSLSFVWSTGVLIGLKSKLWLFQLVPQRKTKKNLVFLLFFLKRCASTTKYWSYFHSSTLRNRVFSVFLRPACCGIAQSVFIPMKYIVTLVLWGKRSGAKYEMTSHRGLNLYLNNVFYFLF